VPFLKNCLLASLTVDPQRADAGSCVVLGGKFVFVLIFRHNGKTTIK
jgi:hypothetical protein